MSSFSNTYFGAFTNKDYCYYYWLLAVCSFIVCVLSILLMIYGAFVARKIDGLGMGTLFGVLLNGLWGYFTNRLLYSMCVNSIH
jgi:hypothetical protein